MFEYENSIIFEIFLGFIKSVWQDVLNILKILLLFSFLESIYITCLLIAGPKRGDEEYLLIPLFFTLFQFIFEAICFLVISPVIFIIKNYILDINGLLSLFCYLFVFILSGSMNFQYIIRIHEN